MNEIRKIAPAAAAMLIGAAALAQNGATPRLADGKPDLNGTWDNGSGIEFVRPVAQGGSICVRGCEPAPEPSSAAAPPVGPDRPVYRAQFRSRVAELEARQVDSDPILRCFPPGVPRIGPPDKIVQQAAQIVFLYDDVTGNFFRIVPTDGRPHRDDADPSFLGDAVGHWEGDTLVVETVNFNGEAWLTDDGSFHTTGLRVVERISRDGDTLTWEATAYDPEVLAEPWNLRPRTAALTDLEIVEAPPCIERDLDHVVDGSHHDNPR